MKAQTLPKIDERHGTDAVHAHQRRVARIVLGDIRVSCTAGKFFTATDSKLLGDASGGVAVKVFNGVRSNQSDFEAFHEEYNQARRLSHPNIARVYDFFDQADFVGYTLELPPGESLSDLLSRCQGEVLAKNYSWAVISAIGSALLQAHMREVIHGALAAESLWLTGDQQLKVLGFGTRLTGSAPLPAAAAAYASCDVLEGHPPRAYDDLYTLACISHELLSGRHPWGGRTALEARRGGGMRLTKPRGIRPAHWRALKQALSHVPARRPASVRDWLAALDIAFKGDRLPPPATQPMTVRRLTPSLSTASAAFAALGCLACAVAYFERTPLQETAPVPVPAPENHETALAASLPVASTVLPVMRKEPAVTLKQSLPQATTPPVLANPRPMPGAISHPPAQRIAGPRFSAATYHVASGSHFAEIHVLRQKGGAVNDQFLWWTTPGTAVAGQDFVPQQTAIQSFSSGSLGTAVFVHLANTRTAGRRFSVCIESALASGAGPVCVPVVL